SNTGTVERGKGAAEEVTSEAASLVSCLLPHPAVSYHQHDHVRKATAYTNTHGDARLQSRRFDVCAEPAGGRARRARRGHRRDSGGPHERPAPPATAAERHGPATADPRARPCGAGRDAAGCRGRVQRAHARLQGRGRGAERALQREKSRNGRHRRVALYAARCRVRRACVALDVRHAHARSARRTDWRAAREHDHVAAARRVGRRTRRHQQRAQRTELPRGGPRRKASRHLQRDRRQDAGRSL
ncbi:hypothetical protein AURDEDRAFT_187349, partial [Auricularia subglabra TFB-10046 SS5]